MRITIVRHGFDILTPLEEIRDFPKRIEIAGRTCYKSEDKITDQSAERFVRMLVKSGHHSVLEHCSISVRIVGDRAMTHQLVRHRLGAYSQESQRYCDYGKSGFQVILPPSIGDLLPGTYVRREEGWFGPEGESDSPKSGGSKGLIAWLDATAQCYQVYLDLRDAGVRPEDARSILPNATKTEIVATYNLRQWRHIFQERALNQRAQWEIREITSEILEKFTALLPIVFEDMKK